MINSERFNLPKVKDFMTKRVISFTPEMDLGEVLKTFNKYRISSGPVLADENSNEVIGFISEDDLMREMPESSFFHSPSLPVRVGDVMNREIIRLGTEMDVFEVEKLFRENNLRHAPVIDDNHNQIGIVSRRDILRALEGLIVEMEKYSEVVRGHKEQSMMKEAQWRLKL